MIKSHRRLFRIAFKLSLLICLPLAGMSWASYNYGGAPWYAVGLTIACIVAMLGAESLVTVTEDELAEMEIKVARDRERRAAEIARLDEKLAKMDRMAKILEDQNHDMRAELITTLVRKQNRRDADDV